MPADCHNKLFLYQKTSLSGGKLSVALHDVIHVLHENATPSIFPVSHLSCWAHSAMLITNDVTFPQSCSITHI